MLRRLGIILILCSAGCSYTPVCNHPEEGVLTNPSGMVEYNGVLFIVNSDTSVRFCSGYISRMDKESGEITGQWELGDSGFLGKAALWENGGEDYLLITERSSDSLLAFNIASEQLEWELNIGSDPYGIAVDGGRNLALVTDLRDNAVSVVDLLNRTEIARLLLPVSLQGYRPTSIVINDDSSTAYISGELGAYLVKMDIESLSIYEGTINLATAVSGLDSRELLLSGDNLYVAMRAPPSLSIIDINTEKILDFIPLNGKPSGVTEDPQGRYIFVTDYLNNMLFVIDRVSRVILNEIEIGDGPSQVITDRDGKYLFSANFRSNTLTRVEIGTWDIKEFPPQ